MGGCVASGHGVGRGGRASLQPTAPGTHGCSDQPFSPAEFKSRLPQCWLPNCLQEFGHQQFPGKMLDVQRFKKSQDLTEHVRALILWIL